MKGTIRLLYKKIIDSASSPAWEKCAFNDSYQEFLMKAQLYNKDKKYNSFSELLANVPGAEKLHYLVSPAIAAYMRQFDGIVPCIANSLGEPFLRFKNYKFEILSSSLADITKHRIAISFVTEPLTWIDTIGTQLLVSTNISADNKQE